MRSTRKDEPARWLGVSISDRYAEAPAPVTICGLDLAGDHVKPHFWSWEWDPPGEPLALDVVLEEIRDAQAVVVDGPQGLARSGRQGRRCEGLKEATERTPASLPAAEEGPGGYTRSAVELAKAMYDLGVRISPNGQRFGVNEIIPEVLWRELAPALADDEELDDDARVHILNSLSVDPDPIRNSKFDLRPSLNACLAALVAVAADGAARGLMVRPYGDNVSLGGDGWLREGPVLGLILHKWRLDAVAAALTPELEGAALADALEETPPADGGRAPMAPAGPRVPVPVVAPRERPRPDDAKAMTRAEALLEDLSARLRGGRPTVVTYLGAFERLFPHKARRARRWDPAFIDDVLGAAMNTSTAAARGLGEVRLDSFIVDSQFLRPGNVHWGTAAYGRDDWMSVLGLAEVLDAGEDAG
jgi:hypothetical protein